MALTKLLKDLNYIQALSDRPNTADGLTSTELKERFDQAGNDIKSFLNNTLIPELDENTYVSDDDARLTDSRKCNNQFDDYKVALSNLHISSGTALPSTGEDGDIFFLY